MSPWGLQTEGRHTFSVSLLKTQFQSTWGHLVSFQDTEVSSLIQLARRKRQLCSVEITHWPLCSVSHVWLSATTWTVACQAPLSKGFCWQEYWSGLPFPRLVLVWICPLELREGHGGWRCVPYKKPGTKKLPCPEAPQDPDQFHAEEKMLTTVQLYGQMWTHSSKKGNVK